MPEAPVHCLLLSGGLDSTTLAAWVKEQHPGKPVKAYTFLYGQKHAVELEAARVVAKAFDMEHFLIDLPPIHGSALTDADVALPEGRDLATITGVAPSYVPARNLLFLAQMASLPRRVRAGDVYGWVCTMTTIPAIPTAGPSSSRPPTGPCDWERSTACGCEAPFVALVQGRHRPLGSGPRRTLRAHSLLLSGPRPACGVCDTCQAQSGRVRSRGGDRSHPVRGAGSGGRRTERRRMKTAITVASTFAAAHRLPEHEGKCCRLHGHTYGLEVTVEGAPQTSGPAAGMIMDFADLRATGERDDRGRPGPPVAQRPVRFRAHRRGRGRLGFRASEGAGVPVVRVRLAEGPNTYVEVMA